jgi:hypothetical protein
MPVSTEVDAAMAALEARWRHERRGRLAQALVDNEDRQLCDYDTWFTIDPVTEEERVCAAEVALRLMVDEAVCTGHMHSPEGPFTHYWPTDSEKTIFDAAVHYFGVDMYEVRKDNDDNEIPFSAIATGILNGDYTIGDK